MIGRVFGRYTVIDYAPRRNGNIYLLCKCECGAIKEVGIYNLKRGTTQSCGCLQKYRASQSNTRHGYTKNNVKTPEYNTWMQMRRRCNNPLNPKYPIYGGRGITVCKEWDSFACFLNDMGERPSAGHSIDRIDNNKGYLKANCRWATLSEQQRNTSQNRKVSYKGKNYTSVAELAEFLGRDYHLILYRVKAGWSDDLIDTPPDDKKSADMSKRWAKQKNLAT